MGERLEVPVLAVGDGWTLRPWELGDLPLVEEASRDDYIPLITTIPAVYSPEAGAAFVRRQWDRAATGAGYPFVIVGGHDGRPVGTIGLWLRDLDEGRADVGYWVAGSARRQGAASRALRAVTAWALDDLGIPRLQLRVEPGNTASERTAERAGYRREGLLPGRLQIGDRRRDLVLYSREATAGRGGVRA